MFNNTMKISLRISVTILNMLIVFLFVGCGGGGGGGGNNNVSSSNNPSVSNLEYSPKAILLNSGSGSVNIDCTFDFSDPNGDIDTVTITYFNSHGTQLATSTETIQGITGYKSGWISGSIITDTSEVDSYTFEIYLSDVSGNQSNKLIGAYTVSSTPIQFGTTGGDSAFGITTDTNGNIYIAGITDSNLDGNINAGLLDSFLIKYDSSFTRQWTRLFGTMWTDVAKEIAMDKVGNIYITGYTELGLDGNTSAGGNDIYLVKYHSAGTKQWTKQLGSSADDNAEDIAVDENGNIYITGHTFGNLDGNVNAGPGTSDLFIVKYNSSGIKQWTKQLGTTFPDYGEGIAVDSNGDIYIAGHSYGNFDGNANNGIYDLLLIKLDSSGVMQWSRQFGTFYTDYAYDVALDSDRNVYITGITEGGLDGNTNAGGKDIFLTKFDSSGVKQWTRQFGSAGNDEAYGVVVDINGNIYVTGSTSDNWSSTDVLLLKFDSSGILQWNRQLENNGGESATNIATDLNGYIYLTGNAYSSFLWNVNAGSEDFFLTKYNSSGVLQ
jgi:hypothetical protein